MLRSFRVANHGSIRDEQELLLMPAYDKDRDALSVAAILGANASGKSTLLDALRFMSDAVYASYRRWEPNEGVPRRPFRLDKRHLGKPSHFVVDVLIDGVRWTYGFVVDSDRVVEEWLFTYPHARRRVIFERRSGQLELGSTVEDRQDRAKSLNRLVRDNALFLSLGAQTDVAEVAPMYAWFRTGLELHRHGRRADEGLVALLDRHPERLHEVGRLIAAADLGIRNVSVKTSPSDQAARDPFGEELRRARNALDAALRDGDKAAIHKAEIRLVGVEEFLEQEGSQRRLFFDHGGTDLGIQDESDGTRAWIALLSSALVALDAGRTLVVDEIDSSLHPRLVARLIELFRDDRTNAKGGQLIFTTHDATLLGTSFGRPVLGRDEVWFVQKDETGATSIYPLSDFHPRKGENAERRYLGGSYGAVPAVYSDTLVEELLNSRQGTASAAS